MLIRFIKVIIYNFYILFRFIFFTTYFNIF